MYRQTAQQILVVMHTTHIITFHKDEIWFLEYHVAEHSQVLDIVVLLTDTHTYCLYTHSGDGSF